MQNLSTLVVHSLNILLQYNKKWKWSLESILTSKASSLIRLYLVTLWLHLSSHSGWWCFCLWNWSCDLSQIFWWQWETNCFCFLSSFFMWANYSLIEKEALSNFRSKKVRMFLYCRKFLLVTYHKPPLGILGSKKGIHSLAAARLQRWAVLLPACSPVWDSVSANRSIR